MLELLRMLDMLRLLELRCGANGHSGGLRSAGALRLHPASRLSKPDDGAATDIGPCDANCASPIDVSRIAKGGTGSSDGQQHANFAADSAKGPRRGQLHQS